MVASGTASHNLLHLLRSLPESDALQAMAVLLARYFSTEVAPREVGQLLGIEGGFHKLAALNLLV